MSDQTKLSALRERALRIFNAKTHDESWQNQVARDLNIVLARVEWALTFGSDLDLAFAEAALRVVERVADFEEIQLHAAP